MSPLSFESSCKCLTRNRGLTLLGPEPHSSSTSPDPHSSFTSPEQWTSGPELHSTPPPSVQVSILYMNPVVPTSGRRLLQEHSGPGSGTGMDPGSAMSMDPGSGMSVDSDIRRLLLPAGGARGAGRDGRAEGQERLQGPRAAQGSGGPRVQDKVEGGDDAPAPSSRGTLGTADENPEPHPDPDPNSDVGVELPVFERVRVASRGPETVPTGLQLPARRPPGPGVTTGRAGGARGPGTSGAGGAGGVAEVASTRTRVEGGPRLPAFTLVSPDPVQDTDLDPDPGQVWRPYQDPGHTGAQPYRVHQVLDLDPASLDSLDPHPMSLDSLDLYLMSRGLPRRQLQQAAAPGLHLSSQLDPSLHGLKHGRRLQQAVAPSSYLMGFTINGLADQQAAQAAMLNLLAASSSGESC